MTPVGTVCCHVPAHKGNQSTGTMRFLPTQPQVLKPCPCVLPLPLPRVASTSFPSPSCQKLAARPRPGPLPWPAPHPARPAAHSLPAFQPLPHQVAHRSPSPAHRKLTTTSAAKTAAVAQSAAPTPGSRRQPLKPTCSGAVTAAEVMASSTSVDQLGGGGERGGRGRRVGRGLPSRSVILPARGSTQKVRS